MKLTKEQKLLAIMLAQIHQKLGIEDGIDAGLVLEAVTTDNEWAIDWKYSTAYWMKGEFPAHVQHVVDVLDMYGIMETTFDRLSADDQAKFKAETGSDKPHFPGFDGTNEYEYRDAVRIMVTKLDRFDWLRGGREHTNSHYPTVEINERMLHAWKPIRNQIGSGKDKVDVDDLIAICKARAYPGNPRG